MENESRQEAIRDDLKKYLDLEIREVKMKLPDKLFDHLRSVPVPMKTGLHLLGEASVRKFVLIACVDCKFSAEDSNRMVVAALDKDFFGKYASSKFTQIKDWGLHLNVKWCYYYLMELIGYCIAGGFELSSYFIIADVLRSSMIFKCLADASRKEINRLYVLADSEKEMKDMERRCNALEKENNILSASTMKSNPALVMFPDESELWRSHLITLLTKPEYSRNSKKHWFNPERVMLQIIQLGSHYLHACEIMDTNIDADDLKETIMHFVEDRISYESSHSEPDLNANLEFKEHNKDPEYKVIVRALSDPVTVPVLTTNKHIIDCLIDDDDETYKSWYPFGIPRNKKDWEVLFEKSRVDAFGRSIFDAEGYPLLHNYYGNTVRAWWLMQYDKNVSVAAILDHKTNHMNPISN